MINHISSDLLIDFVHHELTPGDDALVHAHLAECAECRCEYERESAFTDMLRAAAAAEETEMPSLVAARVWEAVRSARPSPFAWLAVLLRPAFAVPMAAALAVGLFFAFPLSHSGSVPTIDATYYLEQHAAQQAENPFSERGVTTQPADREALEGGRSAAQLAEENDLAADALDVFSAAR